MSEQIASTFWNEKSPSLVATHKELPLHVSERTLHTYLIWHSCGLFSKALRWLPSALTRDGIGVCAEAACFLPTTVVAHIRTAIEETF